MIPVGARWRKSSYSAGTNNQCLEVVDDLPGEVPVRDSKNPQGPALILPAGAWTALVEHIKR